MYRNNNINVTPDLIKKAIWGVVAVVVFTIGMAFIRPWYNVWTRKWKVKRNSQRQNRTVRSR